MVDNMNKVLINDYKCKEIKKQITLILRRLKEIQQSLLNPESSLSSNLSKIISDLASALEDDLHPYKSVIPDARPPEIPVTPPKEKTKDTTGFHLSQVDSIDSSETLKTPLVKEEKVEEEHESKEKIGLKMKQETVQLSQMSQMVTVAEDSS